MKTRLLLSSLAFVFAVSILLTSLASASQANSSGTKVNDSRELYFNREILPDHVIYPVLMVADRIKLETANHTDRIFLELQFSNARLEMANQLFAQGKKTIGVTTLTKSLKYLQDAALDAQQVAAPASVRSVIIRAIEYNGKEVTKLMPAIPDQDQQAIKQLLGENVVIATSLK